MGELLRLFLKKLKDSKGTKKGAHTNSKSNEVVSFVSHKFDPRKSGINPNTVKKVFDVSMVYGIVMEVGFAINFVWDMLSPYINDYINQKKFNIELPFMELDDNGKVIDSGDEISTSTLSWLRLIKEIGVPGFIEVVSSIKEIISDSRVLSVHYSPDDMKDSKHVTGSSVIQLDNPEDLSSINKNTNFSKLGFDIDLFKKKPITVSMSQVGGSISKPNYDATVVTIGNKSIGVTTKTQASNPSTFSHLPKEDGGEMIIHEPTSTHNVEHNKEEILLVPDDNTDKVDIGLNNIVRFIKMLFVTDDLLIDNNTEKPIDVKGLTNPFFFEGFNQKLNEAVHSSSVVIVKKDEKPLYDGSSESLSNSEDTADFVYSHQHMISDLLTEVGFERSERINFYSTQMLITDVVVRCFSTLDKLQYDPIRGWNNIFNGSVENLSSHDHFIDRVLLQRYLINLIDLVLQVGYSSMDNDNRKAKIKDHILRIESLMANSDFMVMPSGINVASWHIDDQKSTVKEDLLDITDAFETNSSNVDNNISVNEKPIIVNLMVGDA